MLKILLESLPFNFFSRWCFRTDVSLRIIGKCNVNRQGSEMKGHVQPKIGLGPVHKYPEICENANFFYEYGLRPHVSSVFSGRIRKFLKTLSRVEIFLSHTNTYRCGRLYPQICEYAYVIFLHPFFMASIINKHGVQQGCIFFVNCSDF